MTLAKPGPLIIVPPYRQTIAWWTLGLSTMSMNSDGLVVPVD